MHKKLREMKCKTPKEYWAVLNKKKQNTDVPVSVNRLYEYFSTLVSFEETRSSENCSQETSEHGYDSTFLDRIIVEYRYDCPNL